MLSLLVLLCVEITIFYFFIFYREDLIPVTKSSVLLKEIKRIQKGSGKYDLCLNLICSQREITLQIEDNELRKLILSGLVALVDKLKKPNGEMRSMGDADPAPAPAPSRKKK
jgi:hypothetical protein